MVNRYFKCFNKKFFDLFKLYGIELVFIFLLVFYVTN
jgi:hypothetical protein